MDNSPNREAGPPSAEAWIGGVKFDLGNRYKLLSLLGRGTFGTVAAGCDVESGKKVAIKHVHPIADNLSGARHILREVATMKLLRNHPNVRKRDRAHIMLVVIYACIGKSRGWASPTHRVCLGHIITVTFRHQVCTSYLIFGGGSGENALIAWMLE